MSSTTPVHEDQGMEPEFVTWFRLAKKEMQQELGEAPATIDRFRSHLVGAMPSDPDIVLAVIERAAVLNSEFSVWSAFRADAYRWPQELVADYILHVRHYDVVDAYDRFTGRVRVRVRPHRLDILRVSHSS